MGGGTVFVDGSGSNGGSGSVDRSDLVGGSGSGVGLGFVKGSDWVAGSGSI